MATNAGQMTVIVQANPQWVACDGKTHAGYAPLPAPPRPHTIAPSVGTRRDYWRRNMGFGSTLGIGGWRLRVPYDPAGNYFVSLADDSSEGALASPYTVQKPPPNVR